MKTLQLTIMISMAIMAPLTFMLALSDAGNALIKAYGVSGTAVIAGIVSLFSAYLIVRYRDEA